MLSKASIVEDLGMNRSSLTRLVVHSLSNHRQYQVLVYQNVELKTMLTGSTTPSVSLAVLAQLFSTRFPH